MLTALPLPSDASNGSLARQFPFVQLEFTHALGPTTGRYIVRSASVDEARSAETLLQFGVVLARASSPRRRRRARGAANGDEPEPVALEVVTHIRVDLGGEEAAAKRWMEACREDAAMSAAWLHEALGLTNLAIRAHRASCADPYYGELATTDPRAVRIGYGPAAAVSRGEWVDAFTLPRPRHPQASHAVRSAPSEAVAAALGGRQVSGHADELLLRGLLDLDQSRLPCAAIQLASAARMARAEIQPTASQTAELAARIADLPALIAQLDVVASELQDVPAAREPDLRNAARQLRELLDSWREYELASRRGA